MQSSQELLLRTYCTTGNKEGVAEIISPGLSQLTDCDGETALQVAAAFGHENIVNFLIDVDPHHNIDATNHLGWTALMQAARNGHTSIVIKLLAHNANVLLTNRYGTNLLSIAVASENLPTVTVISKAIIKTRQTNIITSIDPISCLSTATLFGNSVILAMLLQDNSIDTTSKYGLTPLMVATAVGNSISVNSLLDNKANKYVLNCLNQTSFDIAYTNGDNNMMRLLTGKTNIQDNAQYFSPLNPVFSSSFICSNCLTTCKDTIKLPNHNSFGASLPLIGSPFQNGTTRRFIKSSPRHASPHKPVCKKVTRQSQYLSSSEPYPQTHRDLALSPSLIITSHSIANNTLNSSPHHFQIPPDYSRHRMELNKENYLKDIDSSGYGSSIDLTPKVISPAQGSNFRQTNTLKGEAKDSNLKIRWSKFRNKMTYKKSPKYSFSPKSQGSPLQTAAQSSQLNSLLQWLDLTEYAAIFSRQQLDPETFLAMTDDDLLEIGIESPHARINVMNKITWFRESDFFVEF